MNCEILLNLSLICIKQIIINNDYQEIIVKLSRSRITCSHFNHKTLHKKVTFIEIISGFSLKFWEEFGSLHTFNIYHYLLYLIFLIIINYIKKTFFFHQATCSCLQIPFNLFQYAVQISFLWMSWYEKRLRNITLNFRPGFLTLSLPPEGFQWNMQSYLSERWLIVLIRFSKLKSQLISEILKVPL